MPLTKVAVGIITSVLQAPDEIGPDVFLWLAVVDNDEPRIEAVRFEQRVELTQLKAEIRDPLAADCDRLAEDLCPGLRTFVEHVVLSEAGKPRIDPGGEIFQVISPKAAFVPRKIGTAAS